MGIEIAALPQMDRSVEGIVEVMLDATRHHQKPLDQDRLFGWHAALFPTGRSGMRKIIVGGWRTDALGPMQVVSGAVGREKVHYEAPPHDRLNAEMTRFLTWLNAGPATDPVLTSALAHFWFVTIHPFDDGNGRIARGGIRWSDRREDFRTEVLGLVKAQMVKNAVIVPTGSKGGFYPKALPDPTVDREAWLEEGKASYRMFISGLLDLTDNRVGGDIVPPADVVRHDGDDPYLVVAADKGTASFSDIANGVAQSYGFWLDDAFASGGSAGYDHKGMGITARGAWESVKRHFREMGHDTQTEDFTVVGVGDMSGDVFGNGMLLSEHIRLLAAFDHRHIFLDPNPDAAVSHAERRRLFDLPRSSWDDYDKSLISAGGGVFARSLKAIPVSAEMIAALGLPKGTTSMTPAELMKAVLLAPADLLWNGGIGTYVKASTEDNLSVGDRANDAIRVNGRELRVKVVGEGGNLGCSQLGRIEAAFNGVRINTDAIDNSAGVDTSDHEVNIKILLGLAIALVAGGSYVAGSGGDGSNAEGAALAGFIAQIAAFPM